MQQEATLPPNTSATGGYLTPTTPAPTGDIALDRFLSNLIAGVTGIPGNLVRARYIAEPAPVPLASVDWVAFGVTAIDRQPGTPAIFHFGSGDGHDEIQEHELLTVLMSFYGPNCEQNAALCRDGLHIAQNWEQANSRELYYEEVRGIVVLAEQVNTQWYRRADMEVRIGRGVTRSYDVLNVLNASGVNHQAGSAPDIVQPWNTENS
jgi:hypothetical protein